MTILTVWYHLPCSPLQVCALEQWIIGIYGNIFHYDCTCMILYDNKTELFFSFCGHLFCSGCLRELSHQSIQQLLRHFYKMCQTYGGSTVCTIETWQHTCYLSIYFALNYKCQPHSHEEKSEGQSQSESSWNIFWQSIHLLLWYLSQNLKARGWQADNVYARCRVTTAVRITSSIDVIRRTSLRVWVCGSLWWDDGGGERCQTGHSKMSKWVELWWLWRPYHIIFYIICPTTLV